MIKQCKCEPCNNACAIWKYKQSGQLYEIDVIVYSYLLVRSLIAVGKKEFFSLVLLDLTPLYIRPEGSSVISPSWGGRGSWGCRRLRSIAVVLPYYTVIQLVKMLSTMHHRGCWGSQATCQTSSASWVLLNSCVVLSDQVRSSLMWMPRYLKLLTSLLQAPGWIVPDEVSSSSSCLLSPSSCPCWGWGCCPHTIIPNFHCIRLRCIASPPCQRSKYVSL